MGRWETRASSRLPLLCVQVLGNHLKQFLQERTKSSHLVLGNQICRDSVLAVVPLEPGPQFLAKLGQELIDAGKLFLAPLARQPPEYLLVDRRPQSLRGVVRSRSPFLSGTLWMTFLKVSASHVVCGGKLIDQQTP